MEHAAQEIGGLIIEHVASHSTDNRAAAADPRFAEWYLASMRAYHADHPDLSCVVCETPVTCPEQLRLFLAQPYHAHCFRIEYAHSRDELHQSADKCFYDEVRGIVPLRLMHG